MEKMVEVERATQEELRQDPMYALKLDLIARLELVGILYEYSPNPLFELMLARPLSRIAADGKLIRDAG